MSVGQNIFIDFSIIQASDKIILREELDVLVMRKNNIFIWSKLVKPETMKAYCLTVKYDFKEEREQQIKVIELRKKKKTFKEISDATGVPLNKISYFLTSDPAQPWTLDAWIKDYLIKDSTIYPKADYIIDPDPKFVLRFKAKGIDGTAIEKV